MGQSEIGYKHKLIRKEKNPMIISQTIKDKSSNNNDTKIEDLKIDTQEINKNIKKSERKTVSYSKNNLSLDCTNILNNGTNSPVFSGRTSKYQHYLNFLYKNNFLSLSYDELSAFIIQLYWRKYFIKELKNNCTGFIEIIYTSETKDINISIFNYLNKEKFPYKCYNLEKYNNLRKIIDEVNAMGNLPIFFINGYYIGNYDNFNSLINEKKLKKIMKKEYNKICLCCNSVRNDINDKMCKNCGKKYNFFAVNDKKYNLWDVRNEKKEIIIDL